MDRVIDGNIAGNMEKSISGAWLDVVQESRAALVSIMPSTALVPRFIGSSTREARGNLQSHPLFLSSGPYREVRFTSAGVRPSLFDILASGS